MKENENYVDMARNMFFHAILCLKKGMLLIMKEKFHSRKYLKMKDILYPRRELYPNEHCRMKDVMYPHRELHPSEHFKRLSKEELGKKIIKKYKQYGVKLDIINAEAIGHGEGYIYKLRPQKATRTQKILDLTEDVRDSFKRQFQAFDTFKENGQLFLAVSETGIGVVDLWEVVDSPAFKEYVYKMDIPIVVGCDLRGKTKVVDLVKLIHLLVGGSSGSGKSVLLRCIICCIIALQPVWRVNLILFDMGKGDLTIFDGIPHLSYPVVQDVETAVKVVLALVAEMERRLDHPEEFDKWPFLVFISDESSMRVTKFKNKEERDKYTVANSNLLRDGRKVKILVIQVAQETRRDSMKIEMGNFAAKIAFACSDYHQSISILGEAGAEKLPGDGAMYFKSRGNPNPMRLQGAYPEPEDIEGLVAELATEPYNPAKKFVIPESNTDITGLSKDTEIIFEDNPPSQQEPHRDEKHDKELCDIILWALGQELISVLKIIQHFHVGGKRANDVVNRLTNLGIVSEKVSKQPREVLCRCMEDLSDEAIIFLTDNGVSLQTIEEAFLG